MSTENEKRERRFKAWWSARGYRKVVDLTSELEYTTACEFIKFGWMERDLMKEQG